MFIYFRTYAVFICTDEDAAFLVMFGHQFLKIIAVLVSLVCLSLIS